MGNSKIIYFANQPVEVYPENGTSTRDRVSGQCIPYYVTSGYLNISTRWGAGGKCAICVRGSSSAVHTTNRGSIWYRNNVFIQPSANLIGRIRWCGGWLNVTSESISRFKKKKKHILLHILRKQLGIPRLGTLETDSNLWLNRDQPFFINNGKSANSSFHTSAERSSIRVIVVRGECES